MGIVLSQSEYISNSSNSSASHKLTINNSMDRIIVIQCCEVHHVVHANMLSCHQNVLNGSIPFLSINFAASVRGTPTYQPIIHMICRTGSHICPRYQSFP